MKEQLTLEMLASYLPYGISLIDEEINEKFYLAGINYSNNEVLIHDNIDGSIEEYGISFLKPIFRNLQTDLTKEIEHNNERFIPIERLNEYHLAGQHYFGFKIEVDELGVIGYRTPESWLPLLNHFEVWQKLMSWHFWIYDHSYFEKNIILDFNNVAK